MNQESYEYEPEENMLTCPDCDGGEIIVRIVDSFYLNSGELFCHSVKVQDDAECLCVHCGWEGLRKTLKERKKNECH